MEKDYNKNKKKILTQIFKVFSVYFLYFSLFDSIRKCGNIYFVFFVLYLNILNMSQTYFDICFHQYSWNWGWAWQPFKMCQFYVKTVHMQDKMLQNLFSLGLLGNFQRICLTGLIPHIHWFIGSIVILIFSFLKARKITTSLPFLNKEIIC